MSDELRNCPFCGYTGTRRLSSKRPQTTIVSCECLDDTLSEAAWNTRPIEDELRARVKNLEKLLDDALFQIGIIGPKLAEMEDNDKDIADADCFWRSDNEGD
jgi:hypothetical protein